MAQDQHQQLIGGGSHARADHVPPAPIATICGRDQLARWLCGFAILSWAMLMWPLFSAGPLVLDEHGSYWMVDSDLPGTSLQRSLDYAAIPPLSTWTQMLFLRILGKSEAAFRLPSALGMLGAILVCFRIGREADDSLLGGVAALILAWHPEAMDEVRIARCYGLFMLCGALVLWTSLRWADRILAVREAAFWALSAIAMLWTHYTGTLLVAVSGAGVALSCLIAGQFCRASIPRLCFALLALIAGGWPLIPAVIRLREWGEYLNYSQGSVTIWQVIGPFWWAALPTGLLLSSLISRGRTQDVAVTRRAGLIAASALIPPLIIAALLSDEISSLANPRYRVAFAPAGACLAALILCKARSLWGTLIGTAGLLVVAWSFSPLHPLQTGRLGNLADREWGELNHHLQKSSHSSAPIFVQSGLTEGFLVPAFVEDRLFMEYVACRVSRFYVDSPHPRYALPFIWDSRLGTPAFYQKLIESWSVNSGSTFWVACATDTDLNRNSLAGIRQIAEQSGYAIAETREWSNAVLIRYVREDERSPE